MAPRAVIAKLADKNDRLSGWAKELVERRGYKRAAVVLAAKNARIIWALLMNKTEFKTQPVEADYRAPTTGRTRLPAESCNGKR